jgi:hypothetical protein
MKKEDFMAYGFYLLIAIVAFSVGLSGCAAFNNLVKNDALISQLAVEASTARVIHEHPDWQVDAVRITDSAISVIDGNVASDLASIGGYIESQVHWESMLPEEQAIVGTLIAHARQNLEDSFRANGVMKPAEQMVQVRQVLQWINQAARRQ